MRARIISQVVTHIDRVRLGHPARVAVDGRTASGKTTVADELGDALRARGRRVIRTSIDGFHRPKAERYARGRHSAEGYYYDARDLEAVRRLLLDPLGPSGDRFYRTASFDLEADRPVELPPVHAAIDEILIVDGTFLQRPELRDAWDLVLFVDVPEPLASARGVDRDQDRLGGKQAAENLYRERYRPAFALYEQLSRPREHAHILLDNADFNAPTFRIQRSPQHGLSDCSE
jgi:uridine kinase